MVEKHDLKHQHTSSYILKLILLSICILTDLTSNSTSEFETLRDNREESYKIQFLLCSLQILSQISTFTILFSQLFDTLPFQIGLVNVLFERFQTLVVLDFLYIILTLVTVGIRMVSNVDFNT